MTETGLPSTLPPKSSTAICAAVTDPCPVGVDAGPDMSVSTPILTTSSDICASAADDDSNAAATAATTDSLPVNIISLLPLVDGFFSDGFLAIFSFELPHCCTYSA